MKKPSKKKRGRPIEDEPLRNTVKVLFDDKTQKKLVRMAKQRGVKLSALVRGMVESQLNKESER